MTNKDSPLYWERNTEGLKAAAQEKRKQCFQKAEEAIRQLIKENRPINFESVAEAANVTRNWLYNQPELKEQIKTLKAQQTFKGKLPRQIRATDKSKDALILQLRKQNKQLRAELEQANKQLEVLYGYNFGMDEILKENDQLKEEVQRLSNLLAHNPQPKS